MKTPTLYKVSQIHDQQLPATERIDGKWVPARPEGWGGFSLLLRLRLAWGVFTGRYDVIDWEEHLYKGVLKDKDPVKHCPVYKTEGCAFVDGMDCDMNDCEILRNYVKNKGVLIQQPFEKQFKIEDGHSVRPIQRPFFKAYIKNKKRS